MTVRGKRKQKVHVITMGCAKNQVDSEKLMAQLKLSDVEVTSSIEEADIAVINTCGFIHDARQESVDMIIANVKRKARGRLKKVYAMGCLSERFREELIREIPEVDHFFGSQEMPAVLQELGARYREELLGERVLTTPSHTAFLKIAEGCDHPCAFCAIPLMRGKHVSRPMEQVVAEARLLAARGVRELVVIAQDTTYYGLDLYGKRRLADLLERLADIEGIRWVRLMYAYPAGFPLEVLDVMARRPNIARYLDIPIQHIAVPVLKSMRRGISSRALRELLSTIREKVPGVAIRTTLIVGYPAEGEEEFEELLSFVAESRFERLGVFTYSQEEGTAAHPLGDPVSAAEKERRQGRVMELQQEISLAHNEALLNTTREVLVDRVEKGTAVGRTEYDAPEIDNEVYITSKQRIVPGTFVQTRIVDISEYDCYGIDAAEQP